MRLLVIGGTQFSGRALVEAALDQHRADEIACARPTGAPHTGPVSVR